MGDGLTERRATKKRNKRNDLVEKNKKDHQKNEW